MLEGLKKRLGLERDEPIETPWKQEKEVVAEQAVRTTTKGGPPLLKVEFKKRGKKKAWGLRRLNRGIAGGSAIFAFFFGASMLFANPSSEGLFLAALFLLSCYAHIYCLWKTKVKPLSWEEIGNKKQD